MSDRVLIIDALNLFFRSYIADPSLTERGQPIGGVKGFIKVLQRLCKDINPTKIIVVWDGRDASSPRKAINSSYKDNRKKPPKLNRFINNLSVSEELANKICQQIRIIEFLNKMPVIQFRFNSTEADDIIGYLAKHSIVKKEQKVIVSSDKDYYQLCDDTTIIYRPTPNKEVKNEVVTRQSVLDEYKIHVDNFVVARAIAGDKSDNIVGVPRLGLKTIASRFEELASDKKISLNEIFSHAEQEKDNKSVQAYAKILAHKNLILENYELMQLSNPNILQSVKEEIDVTVGNVEYTLNKTEIVKMMLEDGFAELNLLSLFASFNKIVNS